MIRKHAIFWVLIFSHLHAEDRAIEAGADGFLPKSLRRVVNYDGGELLALRQQSQGTGINGGQNSEGSPETRRSTRGRSSANTISVIMGAPVPEKFCEQLAFANATGCARALSDDSFRTAREIHRAWPDSRFL